MPRMVPVESSSVASVGYDADARELYVEFVNGRTYAYSPVSERTYNKLLRAPSKGRFVNFTIKPHHDVRAL